MPAEWERHECTWMAWPSAGYTLGDTDTDADEARRTWAAVALAIADFEPVSLVVTPESAATARVHLDRRTRYPVTLVEAALDDAWMRDIGPTFVTDEHSIAGVDWVFNGWGAQAWARWESDAQIAAFICDRERVDVIDSALVNEGGGIHVDGAGTVLITETVPLDPNRNPHWSKEQVEEELRRTLGVDRIVWLPRGLTRDYEEFGTRGHVDMIATFAPDGSVLVHDQRDATHPDHEISRELMATLDDAGLRTVSVPAPTVLRDAEGWVDYSYINHYVINGAVIMCAFDDPHDDVAAHILGTAYPDREIIPIDARPLFARGGGIHCITQQQPEVTR